VLTALDDRDLRILEILAREGRISKTELARRVNLSPTPCWDRLKRLEDAGLITGYRAEFALQKLGPHVTVFVVVELESHRSADFRVFEKAVGGMDEVGSRVLFENERVRIWEFKLEPGETGNLHRHENDYILVQIEGDRSG